MKKNAHYNAKSTKWLISLVIMLAVSIGVVAGSMAVEKAIALREEAQAPVSASEVVSE